MTLRVLSVPVFALVFAGCGVPTANTDSASASGGGTTTGGGSTSTGAATDSTSGGGGTETQGTTEEPGSSSSSSSSTTSDETTGTTADDTTGGESTSTGDDTTGELIDCAALPQGPLPYTIKLGPKASEDLAFDDVGNLIGVQEGNLFKSPFDGDPSLWIPGAGGFVAGLRMTAKGVLVYSDSSASTIYRVDPGTDFKVMVLSGLEYANGLEVDLDGYLYAAEQSGARVRRIDPATGEFTILAEGLNNPNGLSFSPDYRTLYVGSFGGGTITSIHLKEDMTAESVAPFVTGIGGGALDGMAVDACGNVYVCEFGPATIWRITPDGASVMPLVELGGDTGWIPNMQWGSGIGGWDKDTLYVLDFGATRLFAVPLGVGDKPRAYP